MRLTLVLALALAAVGCGGTALLPPESNLTTDAGDADPGDDAADHCCITEDPSALPDCDLRYNDICHSGDVDGGFLCIPRECVQFPAPDAAR